MKVNYRILIVDDNKSIHDDFKKILCRSEVKDKEIIELENALFDENEDDDTEMPSFRMDDAFQGEEAVEMVRKADTEGDQYDLIFMDIRMPPGIDGIETISRIWGKNPDIKMVICTAYSDYTMDEIISKFGSTDRLLFLQKPYNISEVKEIALSIEKK